VNESRVKL